MGLTSAFIVQQQQSNKRLAEERDKAEKNRRRAVNERDAMILEKDLATALLGKDRELIRRVFDYTDYYTDHTDH